MTEIVTEPLPEIEVTRLLKFIRQEEDNEHTANLFASICADFMRIARHVAKVGFSLSDEWRSADHLVLAIKEHKTRIFALHIRSAGTEDNQSVEVSHVVLRRKESAPKPFFLPEQFEIATTHIIGELFAALPQDRLVAIKNRKEIIPLFEPVVDKLPPTWDEGELKARAQAIADLNPHSKTFRTPFADDNLRVRSFSR